MASPSKENQVLTLILESSPLKKWHFEEIMKEAKVTRLVANKWLKKYLAEKLIIRVKEKGRFPYYTVESNNPVYYSAKRIYMLERLHSSGLLSRLLSLTGIKTIILFGSAVRGDWYAGSDIDIFMLGNLPDFDKKIYEQQLHTQIELHVFKDKREIHAVKTGLIANIINGYVLKGQIQDIVEVA